MAAISFLGLGIAPPATNWGAMLSNGLNFTYSGYWWLTYPPGIAIVLTVVAFNLIGDGLRDAFPGWTRGAGEGGRGGGRAHRVLQVTDLDVDIRLRRSVVHAVRGVSLEVAEGETVGIVGESGCGKSTLGLALAGLLPSNTVLRGSIRLGGRELAGVGERDLRRVRGTEVGIVFQDPMTSLNPTLRIGTQVGEALRVQQGATKAAARAAAAEMLDLVGLPRPSEQLDRFPHELSGGMRQRVLIATPRWSAAPRLLIADEPTRALDVTTQAQIMELFDRLRQTLGMATLLITHDMGVVAGHADRVFVMYAGREAETGRTAEIFDAPRHRYTAALLDSVLRLQTERKSELATIPGRPPDLTVTTAAFARSRRRCRGRVRPSALPDPAKPISAEGRHHWRCYHPADQAEGTQCHGGSPMTAHPTTSDPRRPAAAFTRARSRAAAEPGQRHQALPGRRHAVQVCRPGPGGVGRQPGDHRRQHAGHRGRVGLRQVHPGPHGRRAGEADRGRGPAARHRAGLDEPAAAPRGPLRRADDVPGPGTPRSTRG